MGSGHGPGVARAAPAPRTATLRALLAATAACCALSPGEAAGIGFPLGGDGGPELWDAVVASIGGHPMEPMMALIDSGANLHWRNPEMVRRPPLSQPLRGPLLTLDACGCRGSSRC